jgi:hypothetical protein
MSDTEATYNSAFNLRSNTFSRTDYNFLGWSLDPEATDADYTNGELVNNLTEIGGATVTLYAVWESDVYHITYALDGGSAGINAPTQMNIGNIVNVSNPTKEGYLFIGWTVTGADFNTSTAYYGLDDEDMDPLTSSLTKCGYFTNAAGTYFYDLSDTPDGAITLTANWLLDEFDVTFYDYDQTTVVEASAIYHYGNSVTAPAENPTRANDKSFSYSFLGWTPNGVNIYAPESLPTVGVQDVNYYAVYTRTYLYELTIGSTIVGSASGNPGDQITIEYFVSSNSGVSSLLLLFDYDSDSLDLVSAYTYDVSDPEAAFYYTSGYSGFYATPSGNINSVPYAIAWEGLPNHNGTGKLIRLVFEITETAGGGAYEIGLGIIEAATTNIALDSDSVAYRTYGTQGEFSDVNIN